MKTAIMFDLDGTLWDATKSLSEIWNGVFARHSEVSLRLTPDCLRKLMGKTKAEIAALLFPGKKESDRLAILEECGAAQVPALRATGGILYDGIEETLSELRKTHLLMVVSNCQAGYVQAFLDAHKLGAYFCDYEESGRTGKPKGKNIRLVMKRNRVDRAVFVGDTAGDQAAAAQAGIPFIFAAYGFGSAVQPDGVIHGLRELPDCVKAVWEKSRQG